MRIGDPVWGCRLLDSGFRGHWRRGGFVWQGRVRCRWWARSGSGISGHPPATSARIAHNGGRVRGRTWHQNGLRRLYASIPGRRRRQCGEAGQGVCDGWHRLLLWLRPRGVPENVPFGLPGRVLRGPATPVENDGLTHPVGLGTALPVRAGSQTLPDAREFLSVFRQVTPRGRGATCRPRGTFWLTGGSRLAAMWQWASRRRRRESVRPCTLGWLG